MFQNSAVDWKKSDGRNYTRLATTRQHDTQPFGLLETHAQHDTLWNRYADLFEAGNQRVHIDITVKGDELSRRRCANNPMLGSVVACQRVLVLCLNRLIFRRSGCR